MALSHPHICYHLTAILDKCKTSNEIVEMIEDMQQWLDENILEDYKWSDEHYVHGIAANIKFRYKTDLIAFKLKFGV